jgi:hypothetical protein
MTEKTTVKPAGKASPEADVREAAAGLAAAIEAARAAGYAVAWPSRPEGLAAIAISQTGRAKKG